MSPRALAVAAAIALACLTALPAAAEPLEAVVRDRIAPALPPGLDVVKVHVPASLAKLDVDAAAVVVEVPRELRAGRPSVKVTVRGRPAQFVPVAIAAVAEVAIAQRALPAGTVLAPGDVVVELRPLEPGAPPPAAVNSVVGATVTRPLAAGAPVGRADVAPPPPISRGASVTVEIRRGSVRVRGPGLLENAARPGDSVAVRLVQTRAVVRGTLVAPSTVVVGDAP